MKCNEFQDDRFRHSSDIKVITSLNLEAAILVLLMGGLIMSLSWPQAV
jgi:hypothetical protein